MDTFYHDAIPNASGIYCITCLSTQKVYIGSAINLRKRRKCHFGDLQRNQHRNSKLQNAFNKYGPDAFSFKVIEMVLIPEMLIVREQHYFDVIKPFGDKGYNIERIAGSSLGVKRPPETGQRISAAKKGKPNSNRGKKQTPEAIERHRLAVTGRKHTEEEKRNIGLTQIDRKHSLESREKRRIAALGHAPYNAKAYVVTDPDGIEYTVHGLRPFCKERSLSHSTLIEVAKGKRTHHKRWTARYLESDVN